VQVPSLSSVEALVQAAKRFAVKEGLWADGGQGMGVVLHGIKEPSGDSQPVMRLVALDDSSLPPTLSLNTPGTPGVARFSLRV
jgi:hypothetical protein